MQHIEAKQRDTERKQAREFKETLREIALLEAFDYDECEIEALSESNARFLIAH